MYSQVTQFASAVVFCCCFVKGPVWAADAQYSNIAPDQHLREWLVLGAIPAQEAGAAPNVAESRKMGFELDLLKSAGGEAKVGAESGNALSARGGEYKWKTHASETDTVDLGEAVGQRDFAVAYAAANIEAAEDESRIVGLGSDDAV